MEDNSRRYQRNYYNNFILYTKTFTVNLRTLAEISIDEQYRG